MLWLLREIRWIKNLRIKFRWMKHGKKRRWGGWEEREKSAPIMRKRVRLLWWILAVIEGSKGGINHNKKHRRFQWKNTGRFQWRRQEDFNEEDRKKRRRRQERSFEYGKKEQRRIQENAKRCKKAQKVIATELTVNSSISILGMVYTLL